MVKDDGSDEKDIVEEDLELDCESFSGDSEERTVSSICEDIALTAANLSF